MKYQVNRIPPSPIPIEGTRLDTQTIYKEMGISCLGSPKGSKPQTVFARFSQMGSLSFLHTGDPKQDAVQMGTLAG